MDSLCPVDGETLSRFRDGELPPDQYLKVEAHVPECASCEFRLGRYGLADAFMSRASLPSGSRTRNRTVAASLSVAAALVASVATNVLLTPKARQVPAPPLRLSAAPSETLSSFYARVAPPQGLP
jgi:anti-sigma factor RsiW